MLLTLPASTLVAFIAFLMASATLPLASSALVALNLTAFSYTAGWAPCSGASATSSSMSAPCMGGLARSGDCGCDQPGTPGLAAPHIQLGLCAAARLHTLPLPCLVTSTAFLMASATLPLASSALVALNLACRQLKKRF